MTPEELDDIRNSMAICDRTGFVTPPMKSSDYWLRITKKLLAEIERLRKGQLKLLGEE